VAHLESHLAPPFTTLSTAFDQEMRAFVRTSARNHSRITSTSTSTAYARVSHIPHSVAPRQPISQASYRSCRWPPPARARHHHGVFGTSCSVHSSRMLVTSAFSEGSTLQTPARDTGEDGADATIFALSTPPGKSAIAVVRVSGPACLDVCTLCNIII